MSKFVFPQLVNFFKLLDKDSDLEESPRNF